VYTSQATNKHWLEDVAEAAGLAGLHLDGSPSFSQIRAAWAEVARHSGIAEDALAERVANHFRLKLANLNEVEAHAIKLLPEASARKHGILPLRASDQVVVAATADPMSVHAEQDLQFLSGRRAVFQIAAPGPLQEAIDAAYSRSRIVEFVLQNLAAEVGQTEVEIVHDQTLGSPADSYSDTQPVASLVKRFLRQAASVGAEEVLVEGGVEGGQVKFALGGEPQHFMHLPYPALVRVVRRLKELARLDVTERKRVQVGQFTASVSGRRYVMRARTEPGQAVEAVRIRLTDPSVRRTFSELDLPAQELDAIRALLDAEPGLILVNGAADRARSTLLTAFSRALAQKGPVTVVDTALTVPVEDVLQVQADPESGFRFGEALARALETHPVSVVVSELDSPEAAKLAVEASRRLWVIGALPATDAASAVVSLQNLGVETETLMQTLRGVVNYRSMRKLCDRCRRPVSSTDMLPTRERVLAEALGAEPTSAPVGCAQCHETGYAGDLLVTHTVPLATDALSAIGPTAGAPELRAALQGDSSLVEAALQQVRDGNTSLHEIERNLPPGVISRPEGRDRPLVLVVDDAPEVRLLARSILEARGFDVIEAGDGEAALAQIAKHDDTSLVLLDLNMPRLSGAEVLSHIRSSTRTAQLPVVVLTAEQDPKLEIELMEAGADDYLRKPVEPRRLVVRVQAVLRRASQMHAPTHAQEPPMVAAAF